MYIVHPIVPDPQKSENDQNETPKNNPNPNPGVKVLYFTPWPELLVRTHSVIVCLGNLYAGESGGPVRCFVGPVMCRFAAVILKDAWARIEAHGRALGRMGTHWALHGRALTVRLSSWLD